MTARRTLLIGAAAAIAIASFIIILRDSGRTEAPGGPEGDRPVTGSGEFVAPSLEGTAAPALNPGKATVYSPNDAPVPTDPQGLQLHGLVLTSDGLPSERATIALMRQSGTRPLATSSVDREGRFVLNVADSSIVGLSVVAHDANSNSVSNPAVVERIADGRLGSVLLRLRQAVRVQLVATGSDGVGVPNASVVVSDWPAPRNERSGPAIELGDALIVDRVFRTNDRGECECAIRLGNYCVARAADRGVYGKPVRVRALDEDGPPTRVPVGSNPTVVKLKVIDRRSRSPAAHVSFLLADRGLRLDSREANDEVHGVTDAKGEVDLGLVAVENFPIALALGSERFQVRTFELALEEQGRETYLLELDARPACEVTFVPEGRVASLPPTPRISAKRTDGARGWRPDLSGGGQRDPSIGLRVKFDMSPAILHLGDLTYRLGFADQGTYLVQADFPGGLRVQHEVRVTDAEPARVHVPIPSGRTVRIRLETPSAPEGATDLAVGGLIIDSIGASPRTYYWESPRDPAGHQIWIVSGTSSLRLRAAAGSHLPERPIEVPIWGDSPSDLAVPLGAAAASETALLSWQITVAGEPIALPDVRVGLLEKRRGGGGNLLVFRTNEKGSCSVRVPRGRYATGVVSSGVPGGLKEVQLEGDVEMRLPIDASRPPIGGK